MNKISLLTLSSLAFQVCHKSEKNQSAIFPAPLEIVSELPKRVSSEPTLNGSLLTFSNDLNQIAFMDLGNDDSVPILKSVPYLDYSAYFASSDQSVLATPGHATFFTHIDQGSTFSDRIYPEYDQRDQLKSTFGKSTETIAIRGNRIYAVTQKGPTPILGMFDLQKDGSLNRTDLLLDSWISLVSFQFDQNRIYAYSNNSWDFLVIEAKENETARIIARYETDVFLPQKFHVLQDRFVVHYRYGLEVTDLSDPTRRIKAPKIALDKDYEDRDIAMIGDKLITWRLSDESLHVWTLADPTRPLFIGKFDLPMEENDYIQDVLVQGSRIIVLTDQKTIVLKVK